MKRRDFLRMATIAMTLTLALTVSGCKKKPKTTVLFVNATNGVAAIAGTVSGGAGPAINFTIPAVPIGGIASQTRKSKDAVGSLLNLTGNVTLPGGVVPIPAGTVVVAGKINAFTISGDAVAIPPAVVFTPSDFIQADP